MKKIGICLMVVLSFILVGNTVYDFRMNSRYSVVQFQPSDMTAAKTKEEGAALLEEYLMEDRELAEFSVSDGVSVVFRDAEHRETAYTFDEGYLSKEISVYEKHPGRNWDCVAIYKNLNGNYEKVDGIPQWFSWRQLLNEA